MATPQIFYQPHIAAAQLPTRSATAAAFIIGLISVRWLAGIAENFGVEAISELSAVLMLAGIAVLFLGRMTLALQSALFITGILIWLFCGLLSLAANTVSAPQDAVALLVLLLLYSLLANACFIHLNQPAALPMINGFLRYFILLGGALAAYQIASGTGFVENGKSQIQRAFGSDVHPVSFSIQILAALTGFECIRAKTGRRAGIGYLGVMAVGLAALYLTYSRTAWIMGLIMLCYVVLTLANWPKRIAVAIIAAPVAAIGLFGSDRFSDLKGLGFFLSNFSLENLVFDYRFIDNSVSWRIVNWAYGYQQAAERPLLGFGPGQSASSSYFNLEMHNILLETFFEGGVFGLIAVLITLAGLAKIHRTMPSTSRPDRYCSTLASGFGIALLFAVLFSTSFVDQLMSFVLYILLLAIVATPSQQAEAYK